jgi:hypothetical protein
MGGGLESRCVGLGGGVVGNAKHHPQRTNKIYLYSLRFNTLLDFLICGLERNLTSSAFLFDHIFHLSLRFSRSF